MMKKCEYISTAAKKPFKDQRIFMLFRILLGSIFIMSAVLKIPHQAEFIQIVNSYGVLPYSLAEIYGLLLPWVELIIGCLLILGVLTRFASAVSLAMIASFIIANSFAMFDPGTGTDNLCGCFGAAMPLNHAQSLGIDLFMSIMSLALILRPSSYMSLSLSPNKNTVVRFASLALIIIMFTTMFIPTPTQTAVARQNNPDFDTPANNEPAVDAEEKDLPVLRFFYSDLCHYCQEQKPIIRELEEEYTGKITFIHINTGEDRNAVDQWSIKTVPTMILSKSTAADVEYLRFESRTEKEVLQSNLNALLDGTDAVPITSCDTSAEIAETDEDTTIEETPSDNIDREIDIALIEDTPVFLFFYADWCKYCQEQHPVIDELEQEYGDDITFMRALNEDYPESLVEWGVTGFPSMFLIVGRENDAYVYQEFGGLTDKSVLDASFSQLISTGNLPDNVLQTGYVHHSCSTGKCYENCIVDEFEYPSLMDVERALTDAALDCLGANAADAFKNAYDIAKYGECGYKCGSADSPRDWGDCVQCGIENTIGKIPGAGCVIDLWSFLGDMLEPHADCLAECAAPSSTWKDNRGHPCRDHQGDSSRCVGGNIMESLECSDCEWVVRKVYTCDGGCEMTANGAACKGKCNETDCDDGDECTIDWCYDGECRHEQKFGPDCSCPPDCDDGNKCTTDTCDDSGNCEHSKIPGCCPTSCADGDPCTRDWCDGEGSCRHARMPGCDKPDDNNDYSTFPEYDILPVDDNSQIAVLNSGFADLTLSALATSNRTAALIDPSLQGVHNYGILVIPSGGLSGLDNSFLFRTRLWQYVENGGTLISLSQQRGSEFGALPGGDVGGYGWLEDQACNFSSVGITKYHPILSSQPNLTANLNVDGFFTQVPVNASVLLTRVKNGQPAMILYDYGEGQVLAMTLYLDMSDYVRHQNQDERKIMRDILSWAEANSDIETHGPGTIELSIPVTNPLTSTSSAAAAAFEPGSLIEIAVDVTNTGTTDANSVNFTLYDPFFNPYQLVIRTDVPSGGTVPVDINYQLPGDAEAGVWKILYFLYDDAEFIHAGFGGDFTVGYDIASLSQFQAYITVTNPDGSVVLDTGMPLNIPPGETGRLDVSFNPPVSNEFGIWNARYSVLDSNGNVLMSSSWPFAYSLWAEKPEGWGYHDDKEINFSITSDNEAYVIGKEATFKVEFWNGSDTEKTVTCWYSFPHNYWYTHDDIHGAPGTTRPGHKSNLYTTLVIPARQGDTDGYNSFEYKIHVYSLDRMHAEFFDGDETSYDKLGYASRGFFVSYPYTPITLETDKGQYAAGEDVTITARLTNNMISALDVTTIVSIQDLGDNVLATANVTSSFDPYEVEYQVFTLTIPQSAARGRYQVVVTAMVEGYRGGGKAMSIWVVSPYTVQLSLDKPGKQYAASESMLVGAAMTNFSTVPWEGDVQLEIPAIGYTNTRHVLLDATSSQILVFDDIILPKDIEKGTYAVIFGVPTDNFVESIYFRIPGSRLTMEVSQTQVDAGNNLNVNLNNIGGVDTTAQCSLLIIQESDISLEETVAVQANQTTILPLAIPVSLAGGAYELYGTCTDQATDRSVLLNTMITVYGSDLELSIPGDTYAAGDTIPISLTNSGIFDTSYQCSVDLMDSNGYLASQSTYPGDLDTGQNTTLPFDIPGQASSGSYYLNAGCTDTLTSKTTRLDTVLAITGVETMLTSAPEREVYTTSDTLLLHSQASNTGPALVDGMLKLIVWQTVPYSAGDVTEEWAQRYDVSGSQYDYLGEVIGDVTTDAAGNVYTAGSADNDYITIKYDAAGAELWAASYNGTENGVDYARAIAVDIAGNVYVTGASQVVKQGDLQGTLQYDCTTLKYNAAGVRQWVARYDSPVTNDGCKAIGLDVSGNVYVSGFHYSSTGGQDYLVIKYNSEGVQQWAESYDGGFIDTLRAMAVDAAGNTYVTGSSYGTDFRTNFVTVKFGTGGTNLWAASYNGTAGSNDNPYAIVVDTSGNVYVTGESRAENGFYDYATVKYDSSGTELWDETFDGPFNDNDTATDVAVDSSGNVYVTGDCTTEVMVELFRKDICTVKYDSNGVQQWASEFGDPTERWETLPSRLALGPDDSAYMTGTVPDDDDEYARDIITVKYDPASGVPLWSIRYSGSQGMSDLAAGIAAGADHSVYIVGYGDGSNLTTVKYTQGTATGTLYWEKFIQPIDIDMGSSENIDTAVDIATDFPGVTGKVYHGAELYNSNGQRIAVSETETFYIVDSDLAVTMETEHETYHPGQQVLVSGEVHNGAAAPEDCTLVVTKDGGPIYTESFTLAPGETRTYNTQTTAMNTFLLQATADSVTVSDEIAVVPYNVNLEIIAPDVVGLAPFNASLIIENESNNDYTIDVSFAGSTWDDIALVSGDVLILDTTLSIAADTMLVAALSEDVIMTVQKAVVMGEAATFEVIPAASYDPGTAGIPFTVNNTGLADVDFEVTFTLDGQSVVRNLYVPADSAFSDNVTFIVNTGEYDLGYTSPYGSGTVTITVTGAPEFVVTELPDNLDLVAGDPTWNFKVKNIGGLGGFVEFYLMVPDWEDTQYAWIKVGEEVVFTFVFDIPDDLEDNTYKAYFRINDQQYSLQFNVEGPKITVVPSLDKNLYSEGENATLALLVTNVSQFDLDLFARINLGDYETTENFTLSIAGTASDTTTLIYDVPVDFDSGKLFYGIYMASGRALHLNALYIYEKQLLGLYTDRQVYDIGDTVKVTMEAPYTGTADISAPGYTDQIALPAGASTTQFTVPALVTGTHYIDYTFDGTSGRYPFDVRGYSGRITDFSLDKGTYQAGDNMLVTAVTEVSPAAAGTMSCEILDHWGSGIGQFATPVTLTEGENIIEAQSIFNSISSGLYAVRCLINVEVSGQSLMLASAIQYFDAVGPNAVPLCNAGAPYSATEGAVVIFDAGNSYDLNNDTMQYRWDFDSDGAWDTGWSAESLAYNTWLDDWNGVTTVEVTDGMDSTSDTVMVEVENTPPVVTVYTSDQQVDTGQVVSFSGSFTDYGILDIHTILWNFGDGASSTETLATTHSYSSGGTYVASLTVTDDDGGTDTETVSIDVTGGGQTGGGGGIVIADDTDDDEDEEEDGESPLSEDFTLRNLETTKDKVILGETFTITVVITNTSNSTSSYVLDLELNGTVVQTKEVTLDGSESRTVSFLVIAETVGTYFVKIGELTLFVEVLQPEEAALPPDFTISNLSVTPAEIKPGEKVVISAIIANNGGSEGSFQVILLINNTEEATSDITLLPGMSVPVTFEVTRTATGTYTVSLGGESDQFRVIQDTIATTDEPDVTDEAIEEVPAVRWSLVVIIIAVIVVIGLIIGLFIYRRRRQVV